MKTRVVHTRFWDDGNVRRLSADATYVFMYLLTNERINMCGTFELPIDRISFDTKIGIQRTEEALKELVGTGRIRYSRDWVTIPNVSRYNSYTGPKNDVALEKEISSIPSYVTNTSIDTSIYTPPIGTRNQKSEISKEIGESEREEEMKAFWKEHRKSSIRKDIPGNVQAYEYLKREFGENLPTVLLAARLIQDDSFQNRGFQAKMTNFIGIREKIEQVEAYMIAKVDSRMSIASKLSNIPGR